MPRRCHASAKAPSISSVRSYAATASAHFPCASRISPSVKWLPASVASRASASRAQPWAWANSFSHCSGLAVRTRQRVFPSFTLASAFWQSAAASSDATFDSASLRNRSSSRSQTDFRSRASASPGRSAR